MLKPVLIVIVLSLTVYSAVNQSVLQSLMGKRVIFQMIDTREVAGKVIYLQDSTITLLTYKNILTAIGIDEIESFSEVVITFGPVFGLNFGSFGCNVEICNINLFANSSVLLPVLSQGHLYTFSTGAGRLVNLGNKGWKLNIFTNTSTIFLNLFDEWRTIVTAGLGIGFQYTGNNRFLASFKIPVIGCIITPSSDHKNIKYYYPLALVSLPLIEFGTSF